MKKTTQRSWQGVVIEENGRWTAAKKCPGKKSFTKTFGSKKEADEWISTCPTRR